MRRSLYIVDTSYLLELFAVPGFSEEAAVIEVRKRFSAAGKNGSTFIVPLPCIFELANHVTDVNEGRVRLTKAAQISEAVRTSFERGVPWTITPAECLEVIPEIVAAFADDYVKQGIGLTDSYTIHEANRLKESMRDRVACLVHIWTRDNALKAREPDPEPDPFL